MHFVHCLQEQKVKDLNTMKFLLSHQIFSFNCNSALGFKHMGHSCIHFITLWLKILWGVKEVMREASSAPRSAQAKHK